jgi:uncharacterized protein
VGRELLEFLVAAFVVSWIVGGVGVLALGELGLGLGALCPGLVALWLTRRHEGSFRPLLRRIVRWRIAGRWYAIALLLPALALGAAYGASLVIGAPWGTTQEGRGAGEIVVFFLLAVVLLGGPEEPGWRGYALPRLQSRWNALTASIMLGVIWALWHAPLWFIPGLFIADVNYPAYAAQILGMTVVYTWLFNSTGGSILLAMVLHASNNTVQQFVPMSLTAEVAMAITWCAMAAMLVLACGPRNLSRRPRIDRDSTRARMVSR